MLSLLLRWPIPETTSDDRPILRNFIFLENIFMNGAFRNEYIKLMGCLVACIYLVGCGVAPGPDKSIAGSLLGTAWGATTGAIVGNQVDNRGPGALIGSAAGFVAGLSTGIGLDMAEGTELEQNRQLASLRMQVAGSEARLIEMHKILDQETQVAARGDTNINLLFDADRASLRHGTVAQLQSFSELLKTDPYLKEIIVSGHTDETGDTARNKKLAEARARTVATFLVSQGISEDRITVREFGAQRPLASNDSEVGRQLNRRVEVAVRR
jgi:outer membrane protein OmpA-like peptidoglycan-associated protein